MYKRLTVTTTIMFLMFGVLFAGASQDAKPTDAEKEAYYDDLNAKIDAEKEAYYEALEAEKEAYYNTHKPNTKPQPSRHFELLKDNDIDPAYRVQRPEAVRNLESKHGVDVLGTSLSERNAPGYNNVRTINEDLGEPTYHFDARDDSDPAQKVRLPEDVTPPAGNRECYNWNDAWYYLWWGNNTIGQASLFSLDAGTYSLESVSIADYSGTYLGLTEATATVNVDVANDDGSTASTIATGSLVTDGSTGTLDFGGTSFELAATTLIKVSVYPATDLGVDYTGDGVNDYAPLLLSEDGTAGDGYCGTDSAGVYTAGVYDWDIEFCASGGGGGNECGTFSHYNVFMGGEHVGESDIEEFVVTGLENDMEYCFNVTTVYAEGESEASNDACATPMAPSMSVSTDAISDTLMPGESSGHEFTVENTGGLPFEYAVTVASPGEGGLLGIEIMTDNYPSETTWDLQDGDGNVIETGGPLADPATLYQWEVWLFTSGDYTWTIYDAYGDGICCAYGEGWYNLFVDGEPAGSGGEFASSESVDLSIGEGGGVDWLFAWPGAGSLDPGEADEIEVLMNSADLEEGTYDAYISVSTYFSEHVIAVQMVVDDGVGIVDGGAIPDVFALHQNFPNPFNPVTALPYDVPEIADVKIDIYNLLGQKVRSLVTGEHEPGFYRATWNGKNDRGALVTTGVYIYQITARSNATGEVAFTETRKLVLMK